MIGSDYALDDAFVNECILRYLINHFYGPSSSILLVIEICKVTEILKTHLHKIQDML